MWRPGRMAYAHPANGHHITPQHTGVDKVVDNFVDEPLEESRMTDVSSGSHPGEPWDGVEGQPKGLRTSPAG